MSMVHLTDKEVSDLFDKAFDAECGTASDGCGFQYTAEELYYENQRRYARFWFHAHRNGALTAEMADNPPRYQPWEDFVK